MLYTNELQSHRVKNDIVNAVVKALQLAEEVNSSQHHFMQILQYRKELYCKGNSVLESLWPQSWKSTMKMIEDQGYKDPVDYFICLNNSHTNSYSVLSSLQDTCNLYGQLQSASSCIK